MSKEKFEKLIEYVINDDEAKAKELFHQIVVEKSRQIYEEMMTEEEDEDLEEDAEELDEDEDEDLEEGSMDGDDAMGRMDMDEMGGDAANQLISDVEMDEAGMVEDEDMDAVGDLEDRVANLEDEVDELIAAFDALVDGDDADMDDMDADMDDMDADMDDMDADAEEMDADAEGDAEMVDDTSKMTEGVSLKPAPQPVKSEEGGINKKPVVAANAGGKGPIGNSVKPVHPTGTEAHGRPAPGHKDLISDVQNKVGGNAKLKPANKPVTAQASGVNTKSVTH